MEKVKKMGWEGMGEEKKEGVGEMTEDDAEMFGPLFLLLRS